MVTSLFSIAEVTQLLQAWGAGDRAALDRLIPLVDAELRRLAGHYMRGQGDGHILQTTALVNEAWLKLIDWQNTGWQNRAHFFGIAARLMRQILVDEARRRRAEKHGGNAVRVSMSDVELLAQRKDHDLLALDDALSAITDEELAANVETPFGTYPAWQMFAFAYDEHWHHRGQLYTYARLAGKDAPMLYDYENSPAE